MFSLHERPTKLCDRLSRRELIRIGGLSTLGLSLPSLLAAGERLPLVGAGDRTFGRAKNVIFLWLQGGPPQHETFDPKPDAPAEIRGPFNPIQTNISGMQFCELLPRTSRVADKLAVVRSLSTNSNIHSASGYWVLTGYRYRGPNPRTIQPTDWPFFGSIVKKMKPSEVLPALSTVWIPDIMRLNEDVRPAGQTAGFMGSQWDPDHFTGDPSLPDYKIEGLWQSDVPPLRLTRRKQLLDQIDQHFQQLRHSRSVQVGDRFKHQAMDLLTGGRGRDAFAIEKEPDKVRDRYGRRKWGQCVLLARRLIEAGARLVHVNWPRDPGDNAVDNPLWDTHAQNADRLEDVLCPQFDWTFSALIEDLEQRGLLDETLVVAIGEFGRTPKINAKAGRDHWGSVFSFAMAGAGIAGGQVYGASDRHGAYPTRNRVEPGDLTATIFHLLGIDHGGAFADREGREHRLTEGRPLYKLLGTAPATVERIAPGGDLGRLSPFSDATLLNTNFEDPVPLRPIDFGSRPKGWRAAPLVEERQSERFGVRLVDRGERRHVTIGFGSGSEVAVQKFSKGTQALLAQEIRNPRIGRFLLCVHVRGEGTSRTYYENVLLKNFTCRLIFYRYTDRSKDPTRRKVLSSVEFQPSYGSTGDLDYESFELAVVLAAPGPGQNFAVGNGLGVAVLMEKTSDGVLELATEGGPHGAWIGIDDVRLDFLSGKINEDVKV